MEEKSNTNKKDEKAIISIHEEKMHLSKEVVEKRKITIHKKVNTETVSHDVPLLHDHVQIEHIPVNKEVTEIPKIRETGNVTIIPIIEEVAVITKKIMLVKEIHITKEQIETLEHIETALRSESVTIDKKDVQPKKNNYRNSK
jgi:uncharacterized protein (TIGR02271 family)